MQLFIKANSTALLLAMSSALVSAAPVFNRIASFPVAQNLPVDSDQATITAAEIVAATADGLTLVYTDSVLHALGLIDVADPHKGFVKLISYKPVSKEWGAVHYPLDKVTSGWVDLSEISVLAILCI